MSFLEVDKIHHTYFTPKTATTVLKDISITIEEGEFVSLLGPSGCGKTTLLSIIAGLIHPTYGTIKIGGIHINELKTMIGYMLQQDYLFPWKTIEENITLGLKIMNKYTTENHQRCLELLKAMNLGNVKKQYPNQLSGGMRQRVALVRTLSTDPKILLLDEPFSALDFQTKLKLEDLVSATLKEYNKTAILVTHDIGEAIAMSDRIYLLKANPGEIAKVFNVPNELKQLKPFDARQHPNYSLLFQQIWEELNNLESKTT
ncbi:ABC transporter ATP-binding protein [Bacillus sp. Marseille-P3661]|uniref:ABC transporter ATP-binding protein n=1 Tax=Bacillus sp. Marseille-P3661 TaxID=1936234 RepID=UPI000C81CB43|nr:ABC transporter ATP-binding protein [Bacillus sp. Marseille-P3661]